MILLILKTIAICTSLIAWILLGLALLASFYHWRKGRQSALLISLVLMTLWGMLSVDTWYNGVYLIREAGIVPALDGWGFTLITPLLYLYASYGAKGNYPDKLQWSRHLFVPIALTIIYLGMFLVTSVPDRLIYTWDQFFDYFPEWWTFFRISCYLVWLIQLLVYLPKVLEFLTLKFQKTSVVRRRGIYYILCLYLSAWLALLTPFYFLSFLYHFSILLLGWHLFRWSVCFRFIRNEFKRRVFREQYMHRHPGTFSKEKPKLIVFDSREEERILALLESPDVLHDPDLTIKKLAGMIPTNTTYLSRYFNQQLGVSFNNYVNDRRLDEAEALLRKEADMNIMVIYEQVGFQTNATFYKAFNARYQMTPAQWRKEILADSEASDIL